MDLSNLQLKGLRKNKRRIGRGGKRGTYSGKGSKGQKSRAGASVKPDFRGGDNRLWQLFPKQRGASKKPGGGGNNRPHRKHRFFQLRHKKPIAINLDLFNGFNENDIITPKVLADRKLVLGAGAKYGIKVLNNGSLKKKLSFEGFRFSKSAKEKAEKAGAIIK